MYPDKNAYQQFMGNYSTALGATTFFIIFFGSNIVKLLGWKVGALITPVRFEEAVLREKGFIHRL
jgi:AAA family ATP:ADP antiporter